MASKKTTAPGKPAAKTTAAGKGATTKAAPAPKAGAAAKAAPAKATNPAAEFDAAAKRALALKSVDNDNKLKLYALYKQGSAGDVAGAKPGLFDFVAAAKYDAWSKLKGTPQEEAQRKYVDLVKRLGG